MKVGGEDGIPVVERQRLEAPPRHVDPRRVDEDVDAAEAREHRRAHGRDGVGRAHVAREDRDPVSGFRPGQRRRLGERLRPPPDQRHAPALRRELERDGPADAAARAGDDGGAHH